MTRIHWQTTHAAALIAIISLTVTFQTASGDFAAWEPFVISNHADHESYPSIHGNLVAWEILVSRYGDWDVVAADINHPMSIDVFEIGNSSHHEMLPDVWADMVVFQLKQDRYPDSDIQAALIRPEAVELIDIDVSEFDSRHPRIKNWRIAWNDYYEDTGDWDPALLDILNLDDPAFIALPVTLSHEVFPDLSDDLVVWNHVDEGNLGSLWGAGLFTPEPREFYTFMELDPNAMPAIDGDWAVGRHPDGGIMADNLFDPFPPQQISDSNAADAPVIADHIAVWQDYRHGHWDLYGYNLSTQTEFAIITGQHDQIHPAVAACPGRDGFWVVWEDYSQDPNLGDIHGMWINGPEVTAQENLP